MKPRDARKWQPLCEVVVHWWPKCDYSVDGRCFMRGACWKTTNIACPGWRITVDPDGVAWTWSVEE